MRFQASHITIHFQKRITEVIVTFLIYKDKDKHLKLQSFDINNSHNKSFINFMNMLIQWLMIVKP